MTNKYDTVSTVQRSRDQKGNEKWRNRLRQKGTMNVGAKKAARKQGICSIEMQQMFQIYTFNSMIPPDVGWAHKRLSIMMMSDGDK